MNPTSDSVPDDLSGLAETPAEWKSIGDIDPAVTAYMDQVLEKLNSIMGRLYYLTVTAQMMDPTDEEQRDGIQKCAVEASHLVNELDEAEKSILINLLVVALAQAGLYAVEHGYLPTEEQLDDPINFDRMQHLTQQPPEKLAQWVEEVKARRAANEGGARQSPPTGQPT